MSTLRIKVNLSDPGDVVILKANDVAPAEDWALGPNGVYKDGALVGKFGTFRVHTQRPDVLNSPADLLIYEDRETQA